MRQGKAKRFYEVTDEDLVDFVGEDPLGFESMRTRLAEKYAADGPDEEDCIYRMAKYQFLKRTLPTKRPQMEGYNEYVALDRFNDVLLSGAEESRIRLELDALGGRFGRHLRALVCRRDFDSTEAWTEALQAEIFNKLMPQIVERRHKEEQQLQEPCAKLTEELLARELAYEKLFDEGFDRALNQLMKIKAAKRQITFRKRVRFDRTHPNRLDGSFV
jgi:hypothetical protein